MQWEKFLTFKRCLNVFYFLEAVDLFDCQICLLYHFSQHSGNIRLWICNKLFFEAHWGQTYVSHSKGWRFELVWYLLLFICPSANFKHFDRLVACLIYLIFCHTIVWRRISQTWPNPFSCQLFWTFWSNNRFGELWNAYFCWWRLLVCEKLSKSPWWFLDGSKVNFTISVWNTWLSLLLPHLLSRWRHVLNFL